MVSWAIETRPGNSSAGVKKLNRERGLKIMYVIEIFMTQLRRRSFGQKDVTCDRFGLNFMYLHINIHTVRAGVQLSENVVLDQGFSTFLDQEPLYIFTTNLLSY